MRSTTVTFPVTSEKSGTIYPKFTPGDASRCIYHTLMYRSTGDQICVHVTVLEYSLVIAYEIFIRHGKYPTHLRFDYSSKISHENGWVTCLRPKFQVGVIYMCLRPTLATRKQYFINFSSPGRRPRKLMPWRSVRRPSGVNFLL